MLLYVNKSLLELFRYYYVIVWMDRTEAIPVCSTVCYIRIRELSMKFELSQTDCCWI